MEIHNRRRFDTRHVLVRDHGEHPRRLLGCFGIDLADSSFCDGAMHQRSIGQIVEFEFGRETRFAEHLRMTVDALQCLADVVGMGNQRVHFLIGKNLRDRLHDGLHDAHRIPPASANSRNTLTMVRFANSILKSLWPRPRASASSSSAARRNVSTVAFAPAMAFSAV